MNPQILASDIAPVRATSEPDKRWQTGLKNAIRTRNALLAQLGLDETEVPNNGGSDFPIFVTREFASRMVPGDPHDPLLKQVLSVAEESAEIDGFTVDPLHESEATVTEGLLQKYDGRALMVVTGACAIHCRYCFRRHFPYQTVPRSMADWQPTLNAIAADTTISEILLSGGDPLTLVDPLLRQLIEAIAEIPHVTRLRVHSRLPIVLPSRVTDDLLTSLRTDGIATWMVVHANHPSEIDTSVGQALARLVDNGIPVLNQSVLLRGVNDDLETLVSLSERLVNLRATPYYLHHLDRVAGTAHFAVERAEGERLVSQMRNRLPGYAVPRFVIEEPGESSKTLIR